MAPHGDGKASVAEDSVLGSHDGIALVINEVECKFPAGDENMANRSNEECVRAELIYTIRPHNFQHEKKSAREEFLIYIEMFCQF